MKTRRAMGNLPDEIISEILSRLPVKSLLRFRCVSYPWRNLISSPNFAKLHLKRTSEHNADIDRHSILINSHPDFLHIIYNPSAAESGCEFPVLLVPNHRDIEVLGTFALEYPIMGPRPSIYVVGSCDGLLLLEINCAHLILWNPSTRNYRVLLTCGSLAYQFVLCGFGFDPSIDDYKVMVGSRIRDRYRHCWFNKVEVLTLKTNAWRKVQDLSKLNLDSMAGTLFNGALHWIQGGDSSYKEDETILSFDLAQEQFRELVSVPDASTRGDIVYKKLVVLQGCLCVYRKIGVGIGTNELWVMKKYGVKSSWSKLISVTHVTGIPSHYYFRPIGVLKNGEVLVDMGGKEFVRYSPKDSTFRRSCINGVNEWFKSIAYVESLVSLQ